MSANEKRVSLREILEALPPVARTAMERVLANPDSNPAEVGPLLRQALEAVEFPTRPEPVFALPSSLTAAQRAVAELSSDQRFGWTQLSPYALPNLAWGRQVWLGLLPGGTLETALVAVSEDTTSSRQPLWRALQLASEREKLGAVLNTLPFETALRAIGELLMGRNEVYDLTWADGQLFRDGNLALIHELGDEGKDWALEMAAATVDKEIVVGAQYKEERPGAYIFLALVRAGLPIESRWEAFFPWATTVGEDVYLEFVRALPPERREPLLVPTIRYMPADWALRLLAEFPLPALARAALDPYEPNSKKWMWWVRSLRTLGKKQPLILQVVQKAIGGVPKPLELFVLNLLHAKDVAGLSELQRRQVLAAGRCFDGKDLPLDQRIGAHGPTEEPEDGIDSFFGWVEFRQLGDAQGNPSFDALLYNAGAGTIFRTGTTEDVGYLMDRHVHLTQDDAALRLALQSTVEVAPRWLKGREPAAGAAIKTRAKKPAAAKDPSKAKVGKKKAAPKGPRKR